MVKFNENPFWSIFRAYPIHIILWYVTYYMLHISFAFRFCMEWYSNYYCGTFESYFYLYHHRWFVLDIPEMVPKTAHEFESNKGKDWKLRFLTDQKHWIQSILQIENWHNRLKIGRKMFQSYIRYWPAFNIRIYKTKVCYTGLLLRLSSNYLYGLENALWIFCILKITCK